jgi:hypothetical protein
MLNSTLDDISAVIGYSGTRMLQAWYAGRWVYLPAEARADHSLQLLLGRSRFEALWRAFRCELGLERLWVPTDAEAQRYERLVTVARMLAAGASVRDVADRLGLTLRPAAELRSECIRRGWVEYEREGRRKYRYCGRRRKISGTGEVFDEDPPPRLNDGDWRVGTSPPGSEPPPGPEKSGGAPVF